MGAEGGLAGTGGVRVNLEELDHSSDTVLNLSLFLEASNV